MKRDSPPKLPEPPEENNRDTVIMPDGYDTRRLNQNSAVSAQMASVSAGAVSEGTAFGFLSY